MKEYDVHIEEVYTYVVTVEAESEEESKELAQYEVDRGFPEPGDLYTSDCYIESERDLEEEEAVA